MEPIHQAAYDGDLAAVDRLVAEDGRRLNARIQEYMVLDGDWVVQGCSPLMLAAYKGRGAVLRRLLALGADAGLRDADDDTAAHWACRSEQAQHLALLLDASPACLNACNVGGWTPLLLVASRRDIASLQVLLARGDALDLNDFRDERTRNGALHLAAESAPEVVPLLLDAGADPTICSRDGSTPLDSARRHGQVHSVALLRTAIAEPQRPRLLLKARALIDAARTIHHIQSGGDDGQRRQEEAAPLRKRTRAESQRKALAAALTYLKGRVKEGEELPRVEVVEGEEDEKKLLGCLK